MTEAATLLSAWKAAQARLKTGGIDSPAIDARLLLEASTGASRTDILTDPYRILPTEAVAAYDALIDRRLKREPVSRILGRKGFWKIMLSVTPDVLSPRPDTETILDVALRAFPDPAAPLQILDMGVGSGAIVLALLAERPAANAMGTDVSHEAIAVAKENATNLELDNRVVFLRTEWAAGLPDAAFDLVVSNPPYIPTDDIAGLDPEVRDHDPHLALDGGADGLEAYRAIAPEIARVMKPGGTYAVEIGWDQGQAVKAILEAAGLPTARIVRDLADRDRVVTNGPDPRETPLQGD